MKKKATATATKTKGTSSRYADLKKILEGRRNEILSEVQGRIRGVRAESSQSKLNEVFDAGDVRAFAAGSYVQCGYPRGVPGELQRISPADTMDHSSHSPAHLSLTTTRNLTYPRPQHRLNTAPRSSDYRRRRPETATERPALD